MTNRKWLSHVIATVSLAVFVVLGLASATPQPDTPQQAEIRRLSRLGGEQEGDFFIQTVSNGVIILFYIGNDTHVEIPSQLRGMPVIGIRGSPERVVFGERNLTSITIPDGVITIGTRAFTGNMLTSIAIPDSVTVIEDGAFAGNRLTNITIPDNVVTIGDEAFANNQLANVTIGNSVAAIGEGAFARNQLSSVTFPDSVTSIGDNAFTHNQLASVTIGNNVAAIGEGAFARNQLSSVTFPDSVTSIGRGAFAYNTSSITFRDGITYHGAFDGAGGFRSGRVNLGGGRLLNEIEITGRAGNRTDIRIPLEIQGFPVTRIRQSAFWGNQLTSVTFPDSVTHIGQGAFVNNQLTSVTIPVNIAHIGREAFQSNRLTSITIPDGATIIAIPERLFRNNQLTSVTIPDSVTSVGREAFAGNPLTRITIGNGIGSLNENVFAGSLRDVSQISIGANVSLHGNSEIVWRMFRAAYEANGARAGVYTLRNGSWNWQPR